MGCLYGLGLSAADDGAENIERTLLSFPNISVQVLAKGEDSPGGLDGVLISTQSRTHAEVALPYIETGVATFIEKPMATSVADADRISDAARRSGALVFIGHIYLYNPAFLAALDLLPTLGAIRYLVCEGMNNSPRVNSSVLWDWLPHDLSMARAIFRHGPDYAAAWSLAGGCTPRAAIAKFQFSGVALVSTVSWLSPIRCKKMTIVCDGASLVFDDRAERRLSLSLTMARFPFLPTRSNCR